MIAHSKPKFGDNYNQQSGWIAQVGKGQFHHQFGSNIWETSNNLVKDDEPVLLITLDLNDPKLSSLKTDANDLLPLCSYINSDIWSGRQIFQINPKVKTIKVIELEVQNPQVLDEEDRFQIPFQDKSIELVDMTTEDYPSDETSYWEACDRFLGGDSFIRVLGPPLWLEGVEQVPCKCSSIMKYVCSIGYENLSHRKFIENRSFFIGEEPYIFSCVLTV